MRRYAAAGAALIALANQAGAADLGAPVPGEIEAWRWTGCFLGAHAGGVWGDSSKWIPRTPGGAFEGVSLGSHSVDGVIGGVQAGCDYQLRSGLVVGLAGNYGWSDAGGTHPSTHETGVFYHSDTEALYAVTGRLGYSFGRSLLYVQGGAAWERADYSASTTMIGTAYRAHDTRSGWTIGGGGEYDYYDFGTERITLTPQFTFLPTAFVDIEDTASVVRAGVNFRFGGGARK